MHCEFLCYYQNRALLIMYSSILAFGGFSYFAVAIASFLYTTLPEVSAFGNALNNAFKDRNSGNFIVNSIYIPFCLLLLRASCHPLSLLFKVLLILYIKRISYHLCARQSFNIYPLLISNQLDTYHMFLYTDFLFFLFLFLGPSRIVRLYDLGLGGGCIMAAFLAIIPLRLSTALVVKLGQVSGR